MNRFFPSREFLKWKYCTGSMLLGLTVAVKLHPYANLRPDAARQLAEHLVTVLGDEADVCGDPPSNGLRVY
jgi:hypothetical protein